MWHQRSGSRLPLAILLPVAGFVFLLYHFSSVSSPNSLLSQDQPQANSGSSALAASFARSVAWAKQRAGGASKRDTEKLVDRLLKVPEDEVGKIAICASIHNEGRFISEWLLYNRAVGVDRFYLYDTGSTDDTLVVLQPWIDAGTVVLHQFNHDQKTHFQLTTLQTCTRTYASHTDWLLDCDVDEFYVVPNSLLSLSRSRALLPSDMPDKPLLRLLEDNYLYQTADIVAASRVTFKNNGVLRLPDEASVLVHQTMRDYQMSNMWDKYEYTKSLIHTRHTSGFIIPGAHHVQHNSRPPPNVTIVAADGNAIEAETFKAGSLFRGKIPFRTYEPLVMYHYVQRDLENCLAKLRRAQKVRKGGWRDAVGEEGCKGYELNQQGIEVRPINDRDSFYAGATKDLSMAESWYGQNLAEAIKLVHSRSRRLFPPSTRGNFSTLPHQPLKVDPHPDLVAWWVSRGFDPVFGQEPQEAEEEKRMEEEAERERLRKGEGEKEGGEDEKGHAKRAVQVGVPLPLDSS